MSEREYCRILTIPDSACIAAGCKGSWGFGNQFYVSGGSRPHLPDSNACRRSTKEDEICIHEVKWDTDMHQPTPRKLVSESRGIFMKVQQQQQLQQQQHPEQFGSKKIQLLKFSREYRSVIKACATELQSMIKSETNDEERSGLAGQLEMMEMTELLWSLCEILFVDVIPGGFVLRQLLDWFRLRFYECDEKAQEVVKCSSPDSHESYWETVYSFLLQGRVEDTRRFLSLNTNSSSDVFKRIDTLLAKMPIYSTAAAHQSFAEFEMKWHQWQNACINHLQDGVFAANPNLTTICRILAGDNDVFCELSDLLGTWYCFMISRLLFQNPTVTAVDLQYHTKFCIDQFGGQSHMTSWDNIILCVINLDIHHAISECSSVFSNWWFVAHITDLLQHRGNWESRTLNFGSNMREFLLLEYASSLMSHHSLWQVGIEYLEYCPVFGRDYIAQFLENLPLETEKKAQKVLRLCEKYDLPDQVKIRCKELGIKALRSNRLGSALSWGLRCKDVGFSSYVVEKFLNEYTGSGQFSSIDLIDHLGSSMELSTQLAFLGKYREFHRLYSNEEFKKAADLLLVLLSERTAPKRFWPTLLLDAVPLLETDAVILGSKQTYDLMHCLNDLETSLELNEQKLSKEVEKDQFGLVRLALARNLAKAIVAEGLSSDPANNR